MVRRIAGELVVRKEIALESRCEYWDIDQGLCRALRNALFVTPCGCLRKARRDLFSEFYHQLDEMENRADG